MTDRELSILSYAKFHKLNPPYNNEYLNSHNFFFLDYEGYWVQNVNKTKNSVHNGGWYIKEKEFFKELKIINRKIKLKNLAQKNLYIK